MQLAEAFHGACEAESALKAPSRGQEQQCATFVQAIVFIFPCDWWCVGTLRAVHKTGRLSATFCAVATRTPKTTLAFRRIVLLQWSTTVNMESTVSTRMRSSHSPHRHS